MTFGSHSTTTTRENGGKPSLPVANFRLHNLRLRMRTPLPPLRVTFGNHGTCTTVRKKRGKWYLYYSEKKKRGKQLRNFRLHMRTLPDRASSGHVTGHVTDVTSGALLGRILRNFWLRMRRTYFRSRVTDVTSGHVTSGRSPTLLPHKDAFVRTHILLTTFHTPSI